MGEAKRKRSLPERLAWPYADEFRGTIDLHMLPPVAAINGARIRELTGDMTIPDTQQIRILEALRAVVGDRTFHVGFCLGNETGFSGIGIAVIDRLLMEAPGASLHVEPVAHQDIAWDIVLRHLRTFTGRVLLFAFPDSDVYDAGTAGKFYNNGIQMFDESGQLLKRLTEGRRQRIREQKAAILNRPPPVFYAASGVAQQDSPWIFRLATPAGKVIRTAVWNGRRNYAHEFPEDILRWVGGDKIAIVQVDSPVGVNLRSSLTLTHRLAKEFDGVIHCARDTETFQSILKSFIRLDLESVSPATLPEGWKPEITMFGVGTENEKGEMAI
jgi:hypothetical protein